jgi:hypothetical protein
MQTLNLDFRRRRPNARWIGLIVFGAGLIGTTAAGLEHERLVSDIGSTQALLHKSGAELKPAASRSASELQMSELENKYADAILNQLDLPWDELFSSVESANASSVALLSIESDADNGRVKISAEAKDIPGMLDYTRSLEARSKFADIYLLSHAFQQQDPQHPVRFMLTSNWPVQTANAREPR